MLFFCCRIDGSRMSGNIPDFIGNWTKLTRLWVRFIMLFPITLHLDIWQNYRTFNELVAATCKGHRWRVLFLQQYPNWKIWQNCKLRYPLFLCSSSRWKELKNNYIIKIDVFIVQPILFLLPGGYLMSKEQPWGSPICKTWKPCSICEYCTVIQKESGIYFCR